MPGESATATNGLSRALSGGCAWAKYFLRMCEQRKRLLHSYLPSEAGWKAICGQDCPPSNLRLRLLFKVQRIP